MNEPDRFLKAEQENLPKLGKEFQNIPTWVPTNSAQWSAQGQALATKPTRLALLTISCLVPLEPTSSLVGLFVT